MNKNSVSKHAKARSPAPTAMRKRARGSAGTDAPAIVDESGLLSDLRSLIQSARQRIATVANSTTTLLFWHLGRRLLAENFKDERAEYGKKILASVSRELTVEFGQAFSLRSLYRAIQFRQCFPDLQIVSTLSTQLSWSHFIELLPIETPLARDFYAEMCRFANHCCCRHGTHPLKPSARSQASTCPKASCCHCSGLRSPSTFVSSTKRRTHVGPKPSEVSNLPAMKP